MAAQRDFLTWHKDFLTAQEERQKIRDERLLEMQETKAIHERELFEVNKRVAELTEKKLIRDLGLN